MRPGRDGGAGSKGTLRERLRAVSAAGNSAALAIVALVLINANALFETEREPVTTVTAVSDAATAEAKRDGESRRALLIVIDALRLDTARDASTMPGLSRLAARGGEGVAIVDSLIPSTVAGIRVLATGRIPPPASFFDDFGASGAEKGGVFASVRRAGGRSFVAGNYLWTDLYGEWIDHAKVVPTLGEDDEHVLETTRRALADESFDLVVAHFGRCDDLAHRHGALSREYRDGARWCDAAVEELVTAVDESVAVLVTSDHGVTDAGGHAGPEPMVRRTPLVVAGRGLPGGALGEMRQSDLRGLIERALGIMPAEPVAPASATESRAALSFFALAAVVAILALAFLGHLAAGASSRWQSAALAATLWIALALVFFWRLSGPPFALALLAMVVVLAGSRPPFTAPAGRLALAGLAAGLALGACRILDASLELEGSRAVPGSLRLLLIAALGVAVGVAVGRRAHASPWASGLAGAGMIVASTLLAGASGETVSLSTIDVHHAFDHVDGTLGLPGAVLVIALRHSLPTVSVLLGALPALTAAPAIVTERFMAAAGATLLGQAIAASICYVLATDSVTIGSLAVGALFRVLCETSFVFVGAALVFAAIAPKLREPRNRGEGIGS